jgi:CRP-like cAMP-binding protein
MKNTPAENPSKDPHEINISSEINLSPYSNDIRTFAKSEIIATEGEKSNGWYILLEGKIGVFKHKQQIAEFSKRGVVFGELGFILNTPRTATLIALEETTAVCFYTSLNQLINEHPEVVKNILINLAERLVKTTEDFISYVEKDIKPL